MREETPLRQQPRGSDEAADPDQALVVSNPDDQVGIPTQTNNSTVRRMAQGAAASILLCLLLALGVAVIRGPGPTPLPAETPMVPNNPPTQAPSVELGAPVAAGSARWITGQVSVAEHTLAPVTDPTLWYLKGRHQEVDRVLARTSYRSVWVDDFSGSQLSPAWSSCYPWGACTNAVNGEDQWYLPANVEVHDSTCTITAKRGQYSPPGGQGGPYSYTSGLITTHDSVAARVGGVDVRARSVTGDRLWPALWLLAEDEYWPPEFDIFEQYGRDAVATQTAHLDERRKLTQRTAGFDPSSAFHVYSARWDERTFVFLIDGRVTMVSPRDSDASLYLLMNLAVGSKDLGPPTASTPERAEFTVDEVVFFVDS